MNVIDLILYILYSVFEPSNTATVVTRFDFYSQIEKLRKCELITENEVKQLCGKARYS